MPTRSGIRDGHARPRAAADPRQRGSERTGERSPRANGPPSAITSRPRPASSCGPTTTAPGRSASAPSASASSTRPAPRPARPTCASRRSQRQLVAKCLGEAPIYFRNQQIAPSRSSPSSSDGWLPPCSASPPAIKYRLGPKLPGRAGLGASGAQGPARGLSSGRGGGLPSRRRGARGAPPRPSGCALSDPFGVADGVAREQAGTFVLLEA